MIFVYAGLFLTAGSILMLEIALTRVFAIMMWHHLTYMVVSIAMLGFGAAGSVLTARREGLRTELPARSLALLATAYGFAVMAAFCVATRVPLDTLALSRDPSSLARLGLLYTIISLPFVLGGLVVGLVLTRLAAQVGRLYFADLVGSALGAALAVWLLAAFGASATVMFAGGLGVLGGAAFAQAASRRLRLALVPALPIAAVVCIAFAGGSSSLRIPAVDWRIPYAPGKEFAQLARDTNEGDTRFFSSTAEVEVGPDQPMPPIMGGDFSKVGFTPVMGRLVGQDGTAPTMLYRGGADLDAFPFLDDGQAGTAYVASRARGAHGPRVLIIGVGGGIDVMVALANGASSVTAVEINRAMIDLVEQEFDDYLGGLFHPNRHAYSSRIRLVHGEGRSHVRSSVTPYDVIQLSGVDSFTALSTGAYTLSESYLYTTEAIRDFYDRLNDGGYINFSRFILSHPRKPRETLRLANIAFVALSELGVSDPASHILVFQGYGWASTMIKRGPFQSVEVEALDRFARERGFHGLIFDPLRPPGAPQRPVATFDPRARRHVEDLIAGGHFQNLDDERSRAELVDGVIRAFHLQLRGEAEAVDAEIAALTPGALKRDRRPIRSLVTRLARQAATAQERIDETRRPFEVLLRGSEAQRHDFLATYTHDVSASTDDAPFFFNYYRYGSLVERVIAGVPKSSETTVSDPYHPEYPVGHVVLLASLGQITLLAAVLILLPLRILTRAGVAAPGRGSVFAYFAALGTGFMLVEIVLMQRMVLFLGHPTYSITVVLTALLCSAGLGSLLAGHLEAVTSRVLTVVLGAILLALAVASAGSYWLLPWLLSASFPTRVMTVIALLAPLGIALGMPFPLGIRLVEQRSRELLPWAWAINGFLSVFSSIFCIALGMAIGFSNVLVVAGLVYVAGFAAMLAGPSILSADS